MKFPAHWNREFLEREHGKQFSEQGISSVTRKRPFFTHLFRASLDAICSRRDFAGEENKMSDEIVSRVRHGEAFPLGLVTPLVIALVI